MMMLMHGPFFCFIVGWRYEFHGEKSRGDQSTWLICVCATLISSVADVFYSMQWAPLCSSVSGAMCLQPDSPNIFPSSSSRYVILRGRVSNCVALRAGLLIWILLLSTFHRLYVPCLVSAFELTLAVFFWTFFNLPTPWQSKRLYIAYANDGRQVQM